MGVPDPLYASHALAPTCVHLGAVGAAPGGGLGAQGLHVAAVSAARLGADVFVFALRDAAPWWLAHGFRFLPLPWDSTRWATCP